MSKKPVKITSVVKKQKAVEQKPSTQQSFPAKPLLQRNIKRYHLSMDDIFVQDRDLMTTILIGPADFDALEKVPDDISPEQQVKILRERVNKIIEILKQVYIDNVTNPKPPIIVP